MLFKEFGKPQKRLVTSQKELEELIRLYNHKAHCYITVYGFKTLIEDRWRWRPDYESAVVDKVYLDFDGANAYQNMVEAHEYLLNLQIKHVVNFSGNGYHVFIYLSDYDIINKKEAVRRYALTVSDHQDTSVLGDLARLVRIPFTFHINAKRYCIPLAQDDIDAGESTIIEKATSLDGVKSEMFGHELVDLEEYDYPEEELEEDEFTVEYVPEDGLPACVSEAMNETKPSYHQRFIYFTYVRECGTDLKTAVESVRDVWNHKKFKHSVYEERQPQTIWKHKILFPKRSRVAQLGYCKACGLCM